MDAPHLWIPRCKILEPKREIVVPFGMRGRYKLAVFGGHRGRIETPWIENLITNGGLDMLAVDVSHLDTCAVGAGNTAPDASDTELASLLASTTTTQSVSVFDNNSSPYEITKTIVKRFAQGAAEGNVAEVGIGSAANALFSRALIVDDEGDPTTLTVQSDEYLDVTYQVIGYPPLTDVEDTISITGSGSHDIVFRAAQLGASWQFENSNRLALVTGQSDSCTAYDGALGLVTASPSGSTDQSVSVTNSTYSAGTFQRDVSWTFGLNDGNFAGGIDAVRTTFGPSGSNSSRFYFQCGYSPAIAKDNTKTLALNFRCTWGRTA